MSKALELAKNYARYCLLRGGITYSPQFDELAKELRRLAQMETEYVSLLKAISDAEPVAWANPYGGLLPAKHMEQFATGLEKQMHTIPIYTLNGIKP